MAGPSLKVPSTSSTLTRHRPTDGLPADNDKMERDVSTLRTLGTSALGLIPTLLLVACDVGVNEHITIAAGETSRGAATVNGGIDVGQGATVSGDVSNVNGDILIDRDASVRGVNTVNGDITLGAAATATRIKAVNGDIALGEMAKLSKSIQLTNGNIDLAPGAEVAGNIGIIAGAVELRDGDIQGDVTTVSADVTLTGDSTIGGRLRVKKADNVTGVDQPIIVVGPGSRIVGPLVFEAPARVYVSEQGQIGQVRGVLTEADIVTYAGAQPPLTE